MYSNIFHYAHTMHTTIVFEYDTDHNHDNYYVSKHFSTGYFIILPITDLRGRDVGIHHGRCNGRAESGDRVLLLRNLPAQSQNQK